MFTIGDFARHGRVSVRMLRHYDAIGLLRPAWVDPSTGYRAYAADQLPRLNRTRVICTGDRLANANLIHRKLEQRCRSQHERTSE